MSLTLKLDSHHPDDDTLKKIIEFITTGKTIAFPTETFYALGVSAYNEEAIKKVFAIKGRDYTNPLPIIIEDETMLKEVASEIPATATSLMREFWPGGLTLIFKTSKKIPPLLTAHTDTIAVRISSHPLARMLVAGVGCPITATSANPSGQKSCSSATDVAKSIGNAVDLIVDGGKTEGLLPSTIVDLTSTPPKIVREGIISSQRLYTFFG
jgi:L-threonylcarbamoyladenylate synthase